MKTNLKEVDILIAHGPLAGRVEVAHGALAGLRLLEGEGQTDGERFSISSPGPCRLRLSLAEAVLSPGGGATRVTLRAERPFTFFLRDVTPVFPIYLPDYGYAVVPPGDLRGYPDVAAQVAGRGLRKVLDEYAHQPEESFAGASETVKAQHCPTWLGLSRDMRIFEVGPHREGGYWGYFQPRLHAMEMRHPEGERGTRLRYEFSLGRGSSVEVTTRRSLYGGCLPILEGESRDGDIVYRLRTFVSLESAPLQAGALRGIPALLAYGYAIGNHVEQEAETQAAFTRLKAAFQEDEEETALYFQAEAENTGPSPAYAWFTAPRLYPWYTFIDPRIDRGRGLCLTTDGQVYAAVRLQSQPMQDFETALLLAPGERATYEFAAPHRPLPMERGERLASFDFAGRLEETVRFWREKLGTAARIEVPEKRVEEMIKAGLLHLDLVAYGREPDDPVAACVGVYTPIGLESAPILSFWDSMGWHRLAQRAIEFFLDRQREDGFIQVFADYMLETGGVLWMIGEHYRVTRDLAWIRKIAPRALRACEYLLRWREKNLREELRGAGYGMIEGKVADPKDPQRYFMNSGLACAGLKRTAEWLAEIDSTKAEALAREASCFERDIRAALEECMARSPVIPLRDGTWCPTAPPWAEGAGPCALFCEGEPTFTHHTVMARDSLLGPLWLVFCGVVDPQERIADFLVHSHAELGTVQNVPFSQPYYSRSDYAHLRRGEVKAFLKRYYNGFAALADRETYTFWEHLYEVSPHKTHEEGWFLMETRWMLALEEQERNVLRLLEGIPRAWLSDGQRVAFENLCTYYGPTSLDARSKVSRGVIEAEYACCPGREPARLSIRLPHPQGYPANRVEGGTYDPATETVTIERPRKGMVRLHF